MEGSSLQSLVPTPGEVVVRQSAAYHPSVWGDYFIVHGQSSPKTQESEARIKERAEELKEQVTRMFEDTTDLLQIMNLIDSIQLLGLAYHFEKEISHELSQIYDADISNYGLYHTALRFRLLRQQGYYVSPDVFMKFKDGEEGGFMGTLKDDVKGMLSLYNAAYLGTHGEIILDEAISFTRCQLTSLLCDLEQPFATLVSLALETPLCRRVKRRLARNYISIYQEDATRNETILELAKLDFNLVQLLHRQELKIISIWWRDLGLAKSLCFARDRVVECYYWAITVSYEPHYSRSRLMLAKVLALTSILDDIYDNYSTLEESRLLTEAIQRWEPQAVDQLPEYLKDYYLKLINVFEEFKNELAPEEKYRMLYLKEEMKAQASNYFEEAKWSAERFVPTVEKHLQLSMLTAGNRLLICAFFVGMGEVATKDAFEWVASFPKIIKASSLLSRIIDDIYSHELEQERAHAGSTVECYMKEYGTNANVACKRLRVLVEDAWKDLNKECLNPTTISMSLLESIVNLTLSMEDIYKSHDGYTHSDTITKHHISMLFVQPVPI